MYIENHLTGDDMQRAHDRCPNPPPATLLAGSYLSLLEAIDIFTRESVHPVTSGLLAPTARETVILGPYYRSLGFCRTAIELKSRRPRSRRPRECQGSPHRFRKGTANRLPPNRTADAPS